MKPGALLVSAPALVDKGPPDTKAARSVTRSLYAFIVICDPGRGLR